MTVIRSLSEPLSKDNRPPWSDVTSAGIFRVHVDGGRFDRHFHDCDEYWLVFKGAALIMSDGEEHYVTTGDIVCTPTGAEHDVLEVYESLSAFWFEGPTPDGGRVGHLHKHPNLADGHEVPTRPRPDDFPAS